MRSKVALVIAVLLWTSWSLAQSVRSDLKSGKKHIRSIVLMPVQVSLKRMTLKGAEAMIEESRNTEIPLALEIAAGLRDLGYNLDQATFSHQVMAKDDAARYTVDDVQKRFDLELQQIQRKPNGVRKGRFTLGDQVAKLPLSDRVDALLFARASAKMLTGNKKAFGYFAGAVAWDTAFIELGVVDAKTGEVLYFAKSKVEGNITYDSEQVATSVAKALRDLPHSGPVSLHAPQSPVEESPATDVAVQGSEPRRIRVSHAVLKDMLISSVRPEYPGIASMNFVHGDVVMRVVIDAEGRVADVKATSGPVQLIAAATSAMKQWRYRPLTLNGQAFEADTDITFKFSMGQ